MGTDRLAEIKMQIDSLLDGAGKVSNPSDMRQFDHTVLDILIDIHDELAELARWSSGHNAEDIVHREV